MSNKLAFIRGNLPKYIVVEQGGCIHLASINSHGQFERFVKMTTTRLMQAVGGDRVLRKRR